MADKIVNLVDKDENTLYTVAAAVAANSVNTQAIQDGAVTSDKIDWTSNKTVPRSLTYMPSSGEGNGFNAILYRNGNLVIANITSGLTNVGPISSGTFPTVYTTSGDMSGYTPKTSVSSFLYTHPQNGAQFIGTISPTIDSSNLELSALTSVTGENGVTARMLWFTEDEFPAT